jgi:long-chain fatty acid adenylase/transferase FadD26
VTTIVSGPPTTSAGSLPEILRLRGERQPDRVAYVFLHNGESEEAVLTYGALDRAARARAAVLTAAGLGGGSAVLMYPSGLEFVRTLLGCMYAGVVGAPVQVPSRTRGLERVRRIADDAGTSVVLTTTAVKEEFEQRFAGRPELAGLTLIDTEPIGEEPAGAWPEPAGRGPRPRDIALLQYTSGSTGSPKGVMVSHANFLGNAAETEALWPSRPDGTFVSWLPLFHDMGLLFGVILPLWAGIPSYLMTPAAFVRRPARWLEAIAKFGGTHAAAPSFAYDLCVRAAAGGDVVPAALDLSTWRVAVNGAEPVRWHTIRAFTETFAPSGFAARAMCPGYGLAENTLKATGSPPDRPPAVLRLSAAALARDLVVPADAGDAAADDADVRPLVGCGVPAGTTRLRIVDPVTRRACPPDRIGEVWIGGPCVAAGYRGRPAESEETFRARMDGTAQTARTGETAPPQTGETARMDGTAQTRDREKRGDTRGYLRTGDLGFVHDGELYVTGRLKDVVVRKGRNYYPQDIELSAEEADPLLRPNCAAAFAVDDGETERLVVAVEVDGAVLRTTGAETLRGRVRDRVWDGQRLRVDDVVLIRRGTLPRTSSGKVQRRACRDQYLADALSSVAVRRDT